MFFSLHPFHTLSGRKAPSPGRRATLKSLAALLAAGSLASLPLQASGAPDRRRILIVYFSHTGNTRAVAEQIRAATGGDLLELKTETAYPADHDATVRLAVQERKSDARPRLSTSFPAHMNDYDLVFVGYPVWDYTMPMALYSFFDQFPLPDKTIAPFSTHMGSGLANGPERMARLCPQATVLEGLAVRGSGAAASREAVARWLSKLGVAV